MFYKFMDGPLKNLKSFLKHKFVADTLALQTGTFISMLFTLAQSAVLARFLGPKDYGCYVLVLSIDGIAGLASFLNYHSAVVSRLTPAWFRKDKASILYQLGFYLKTRLFIGIFTGLIGFTLGPIIGEVLYNRRDLGELSRWLAFNALISSPYFLLITLLAAIREMRYVMILEITAAFISFVGYFTILFLGYRLGGIVVATVMISITSAAIALPFYIIIVYRQWEQVLPNCRSLLSALKQVSLLHNLKLGFLTSLDGSLKSLLDLFPVLLLGKYSSSEEAGFYRLGTRIISFPMMLMTGIIRNILPTLGQVGNEPVIFRKKYWKIVALSSTSIALISIVVLAVAPFFIQIVYGHAYSPTIDLVWILGISVVTAGFGVGPANVYILFDRVGSLLNIRLLIMLVCMPIGFIFVQKWGAAGAAAFTVLWQLLQRVATSVHSEQLMRRWIQEPTLYKIG